jgi:hypothetical protein
VLSTVWWKVDVSSYTKLPLQDVKLIFQFLDAFEKLRKANIGAVMSVRTLWNNCVPTGRIFMKTDI